MEILLNSEGTDRVRLVGKYLKGVLRVYQGVLKVGQAKQFLIFSKVGNEKKGENSQLDVESATQSY